ncbi:flavin reductase family protein [Halalkalibacterium ligniniphilum]|uniref:flavin reductase family protein n=1 Tax=Halalkalibacterium ligniniphilum TaxID=1134413 RepID=UPI0003452F8E|nr:flavin reductase family protein [Halalkalibacterium ligniniphilum]
MEINPKDQTRQENYKLLIGSVLPRPIAFITSQNKDGVVNAAPFSFFNVLTAEPPLVGISVGRKPDGSMKDTSRNCQETGEFVIHVVDEQNVEKMNETSANYPADESEVEAVGLTKIPSATVNVPSLRESRIRLECKVDQIISVGGTDDTPAADFVIGQVVHFSIDDELYDNGKINTELLAPVSRLAGSDYGRFGETFSLERPIYDPKET